MAGSKIDKAIEVYIREWKGKKIAIYPFGNMGMETKRIMNWKYGIQETLIVDNHLTNINPHISSLDEVESPDEYVWLVTCSNPEYHKEIILSIISLVPENQIIDIFEDLPIYSEDYELLSQLGTEKARTISSPCWEFLEIVKKKKNESRIISVAELGIGRGASAVEVCKLLSENDTYFCFDYEDSIQKLLSDLNKIPEICCKRVGKGNSRKMFDSYNWNLSELLFQMRNSGKSGIFDVVYLDGAHTFLHDGLACCLLKELLKLGGFLIFDDMFWTYKSGSGALCIERRKLFPEEQICDCQMQRVVNAFMVEDKKFQQIYMERTLNPSRAVYKKIES